VVGSGVSWSAYTHTKLAKKKNCLSLLEKGGRGEPCGCGPGNPSAAKGGWGGGVFQPWSLAGDTGSITWRTLVNCSFA
jgi:hypothetical protein